MHLAYQALLLGLLLGTCAMIATLYAQMVLTGPTGPFSWWAAGVIGTVLVVLLPVMFFRRFQHHIRTARHALSAGSAYGLGVTWLNWILVAESLYSRDSTFFRWTFGIGAGFVLVATIGALVTWVVVRTVPISVVVQDGTLCPYCGYSLIGTSGFRCPECGRHFTYYQLDTTKGEFELRSRKLRGAFRRPGDA